MYEPVRFSTTRWCTKEFGVVLQKKKKKKKKFFLSKVLKKHVLKKQFISVFLISVKKSFFFKVASLIWGTVKTVFAIYLIFFYCILFFYISCLFFE